MVKINRRELGIGLGASAAGTSVFGTFAIAQTAPKVVIIGGGPGGATVANQLKQGDPNLDVTLIEVSKTYTTCFFSNLYFGGFRPYESLRHDYDGISKLGVKLVHQRATEVDTNARVVRTDGGRAFSYDRLVVAPGIDIKFGTIEGYTQQTTGQMPHAYLPGVQTQLFKRQLDGMRDGGTVVLVPPPNPYRCPPGPYERACMVASYLKTAKPRSKVLVLDANPEIQSKKPLFERAFAQHYKDILEYRPNSELKEVAGNVAKLDFEDVKADVLNVVPPQRGGDIARGAGLLNVNNRWVGVNWLSMESTALPGVHVLGDATFPAPTMPKSGHMANQHAKVAAAAIIQLLKGEALNATPVVMNTCYSFVSGKDVIHVASVHQYNAEQKTFLPVQGAGGVSAAANQVEGRYALSWADNIWADSLALP